MSGKFCFRHGPGMALVGIGLHSSQFNGNSHFTCEHTVLPANPDRGDFLAITVDEAGTRFVGTKGNSICLLAGWIAPTVLLWGYT